MGFKWGGIGNTFGEHIGNLKGTHGELERNNGRMKKISTWKIWFQTIVRISHEKNSPNMPDFEKNNLSIARFLLLILVSSQKYF
jgi:hypothetical protein